MKRTRLFGDNSRLTPIAKLIMEENISELEATLNKEWSLNQTVKMTEYIDELVITLALIENKLKVIDFLLGKNVDLNHPKSPAIVTAVSNCSIVTIKKILQAGAKIDLRDAVGKNAYAAALYTSRYDLLDFLFDKGLEIDGAVLRQAVFGRQIKAVNFFLEKGINPNFRKANMVFPYNPTAISIAAQNNDLPMVKLLIAHGADVTLSDDYGNRPYLHAVDNKNAVMMDLLKALEPSEWHDINKKINQFRSWNMPETIIEFLLGENKNLSISHEEISWMEFADMCNTKEVEFDNHLYIDLLKDIDNYGAAGFVTWSVSEKILVHLDYEHREIVPLGYWDAFIKCPEAFVEKVLYR